MLLLEKAGKGSSNCIMRCNGEPKANLKMNSDNFSYHLVFGDMVTRH